MKNQEDFEKIEKKIRIAEHFLYLTDSVFQDKKTLLKILPEINEAVTKALNLILHHEFNYKRITLSKDPKTNFEIFKRKCSANYGITFQEIKKIEELFRIVQRQKRSTMEFVRGEKVVIFLENQEYEVVTSEKTKEFIHLAREILKKTKNKFENFHSFKKAKDI